MKYKTLLCARRKVTIRKKLLELGLLNTSTIFVAVFVTVGGESETRRDKGKTGFVLGAERKMNTIKLSNRS